MQGNKNLSCNSCKSNNLCFGYMGISPNKFVPSGIFTSIGFKVNSYVCLDCGNIGGFLSQEKLNRLKHRLKNRYS